MYWYQYLSLGYLGISFLACLWHFSRIIRLGKPNDFSRKSGNIPKAEIYSYTVAMLPNQKESAYLHAPTFTAGMLYHCGTFLALVLFAAFFFVDPECFPQWLVWTLSALLGVGSACGLSLLLKRIFSKKLRALSSPDDFISNFLPTLFQIITGLYLLFAHPIAPYYYIVTSLLFLYIPIGKLRHFLYFFAARFHLGFFYGWRNTWPPKKHV